MYPICCLLQDVCIPCTQKESKWPPPSTINQVRRATKQGPCHFIEGSWRVCWNSKVPKTQQPLAKNKNYLYRPYIGIYMHTCICVLEMKTYAYTYICMCVESERERERERYIYIYIHTHTKRPYVAQPPTKPASSARLLLHADLVAEPGHHDVASGALWEGGEFAGPMFNILYLYLHIYICAYIYIYNMYMYTSLRVQVPI